MISVKASIERELSSTPNHVVTVHLKLDENNQEKVVHSLPATRGAKWLQKSETKVQSETKVH